MQVTFPSDTKHRKRFFDAGHFAFPAKMHLSLLRWIVERFTNPGEVILDPMAGAGTTMLACQTGRNVVLVELEEKFVNMCHDNWSKVQDIGAEMGYTLGWCEIRQGDARSLDGIANCVISSPPYENSLTDGHTGKRTDGTVMGYTEPVDCVVTSPPYAEQNIRDLTKEGYGSQLVGGAKRNVRQVMPYSENPANLGNLPYGAIDAVITSPPYEASDISQTHMTSDRRGDSSDPYYRPSWKHKLAEGYADTKRPYVDAVISSPPYEAAIRRGDESPSASGKDRPSYGERLAVSRVYSNEPSNIGNLRGSTYLEAMLWVYSQCFNVLKPSGLMILVVKNFIRDKAEVRLDEDTIKLCEQAGFTLQERHYRKLTSQSFWRTIYQQKHPDAPVIGREDVLVLARP